MLGFSFWLSQTEERELPRFALFSFLPSEQTPKGVHSLDLMFPVAAASCREIKCLSSLVTDGSNGLGSKKTASLWTNNIQKANYLSYTMLKV